MNKIAQIILGSGLLLLLSCSGSKKTTSTNDDGNRVDFNKDKKIEWAKANATEEDKVIFVDIYTTWCLPCKLMDQEVFTHPSTADYLNENFINVKIDAEKGVGPEWAFEYGVLAYPTLLFLDKDGNILVRKEGSAFHTELRALGDEAMSKAAAL